MERSRLARSCSFLASTAASSRGLHGASAIECQLAFAHDGIGKCSLLVRQHVGLGNDSQHAHTEAGSPERAKPSPVRTVR